MCYCGQWLCCFLSFTCPGHVLDMSLAASNVLNFAPTPFFCGHEDMCLLWVVVSMSVSVESRFINYWISRTVVGYNTTCMILAMHPFRQYKKYIIPVMQAQSCGLPEWDCLAHQHNISVLVQKQNRDLLPPTPSPLLQRETVTPSAGENLPLLSLF